MWDKISLYPKTESGYLFTSDMNDERVEKFNIQTFTQGSAFLKVKYYNPKHFPSQLLPVKEKVIKMEINRLGNGYITQVLTSVDIQEIIEIGGRVIQRFEGVIYRENFQVSPFEKIIDELFALRLKCKNEGNGVMQLLVKLIMNTLHGEFLRKEKLESYQCKSEMWMITEYDERVLDYQKN